MSQEEGVKMRLKHKTITILILVLCLPVSTVFMANAHVGKEVNFLVWVETPEKQVVVDEIIDTMESLGLIVNTVYMPTLDDWILEETVGIYDLTYGGLSYTFGIDDIFQIAWLLSMINPHMLRHHDIKLNNLIGELTAMLEAAQLDPTVATEEYMAEMIDIFQDVEKRLWKKLYILPFVQWFGGIYFTEVLVPNAKLGHVFNSLGLRKALYHGVDRNVFLDYHATYNPFPVYEVYHLFQMSPYHDTSLPNY